MRGCDRLGHRPGGNLEPVIEPGEAAEHVFLVPGGYRLVAHVPRNAFGVIEVPERARLQLDPRRAQYPGSLEAAERARKVAAGRVDQLRQAEPVLDRHAGPLRQRLQRRMRGVAEQHDAPLRPVPHRIAVADLPAPAEIHHREQLAHRRMGVAVGVLQLRPVGLDVAPLAMGRGAEHGDDVEQRAVAQRVVHDVEARPAPQHHLVAVHVGLQLRHRHDGAVRDIADRARLAVADELGTNQRADAVRSDQRGTGEAAAVGGGDRNAIVAFLEAGDHGVRHQLDFRARACRRRAARYADRCGGR